VASGQIQVAIETVPSFTTRLESDFAA